MSCSNGNCGTAQPEQTSDVRAATKDYYGRVLQTSKDLKTSACTAAGRPPPLVAAALAKVPTEVLTKFYGCGAPLPLGIQGLTVLDLGCGSGRDCYVSSALVGPQGRVIGVDMTHQQLEVANAHKEEFTRTLGYPACNMEFVEGHIEDLAKAGVKDDSVDLIISNCVINLAEDKQAVLHEAWRVLRMGGELYFSDVYSDRRVPEEARRDQVLWGECVSGALYVGDFKRIAAAAGFLDVRMVSSSEIQIPDEFRRLLGPARFYSITYRLFKLPGLMETACEDYGQIVRYKGTIPGSPASYALDQEHSFEVGRPYLVCGNTAAMCGEGGHSWMKHHFDVTGDRSVHYGLFAACGGAPAAAKASAADAPAAAPSAGCC